MKGTEVADSCGTEVAGSKGTEGTGRRVQRLQEEGNNCLERDNVEQARDSVPEI
jgi:hypothetical protein